MQVIVNTDNHITNSKTFENEISHLLSERLEIYSNKITTAEIFLSDMNGSKSGANDKRCVIELHLEGIKPVVATHTSNTLRRAFSGAAGKMKRIVHDTLELRKQR